MGDVRWCKSDGKHSERWWKSLKLMTKFFNHLQMIKAEASICSERCKNWIQMAASNQWDVIPCIFYATECIIWRLGYFKAIKSAWQQILLFFWLFCFCSIILSLKGVPTGNEASVQQAHVIRWLHVNFHKAPFGLSVKIRFFCLSTCLI